MKNMNKKYALVSAFNRNLELEEVPRNKTKYIANKYYIINESCFKTPSGSWNRIDNGKIFFNISSETWELFNQELHSFIITGFKNNLFSVGILNKKESSSQGFPLISFTYTASQNTSDIYEKVKTLFPEYILTTVFNKENYGWMYMTVNVIEEASLVFMPKYHVYCYFFKELKSNIYAKGGERKDLKNYPALQYNLNDTPLLVSKTISRNKLFLKTIKNIPNRYLEAYDTFRNKSFGIEVETRLGIIPFKTCERLGFIPLRDGSLHGGLEYTSIPFQSAEGIYSIEQFYKALQYFCEVNSDCSLHIHIGNFERSKKNALLLYHLAYRMQEEMFSIVPPYKKDTRYWSTKEGFKDHCQSLKNLNIDSNPILNSLDTNDPSFKKEFNKLFKFLTEGHPEGNKFSFEKKNFPKKESSKWNINSRYFWFNLLPYFFYDSETIEFRIFHSPLDFEDVFIFLNICNAFLNYVEDCPEIIMSKKVKITLEDILMNTYSGELLNSMLTYINNKKEEYLTDFIQNTIFGEIDRQNEKYKNNSYSDEVYSSDSQHIFSSNKEQINKDLEQKIKKTLDFGGKYYKNLFEDDLVISNSNLKEREVYTYITNPEPPQKTSIESNNIFYQSSFTEALPTEDLNTSINNLIEERIIQPDLISGSIMDYARCGVRINARIHLIRFYRKLFTLLINNFQQFLQREFLTIRYAERIYHLSLSVFAVQIQINFTPIVNSDLMITITSSISNTIRTVRFNREKNLDLYENISQLQTLINGAEISS